MSQTAEERLMTIADLSMMLGVLIDNLYGWRHRGERPTGDISILPTAVEVAAYRIAQEAISNATKHACAQRITVRMSRTDNGLTVEIDDDGIGVTAHTKPSGMGLVSMTERATELGGWCTNEHSPAGGTGIKAWLPILIEGSAGNT